MTKSSKAKQERRLAVQLILAVSMAIFGCILIIVAFLVPPTGEIHPTVLTAFGEILTLIKRANDWRSSRHPLKEKCLEIALEAEAISCREQMLEIGDYPR